MPWRQPQYRPVGYVINKADDWDVLIDDLRYLKSIFDGIEAQPVMLRSTLTVSSAPPQLTIADASVSGSSSKYLGVTGSTLQILRSSSASPLFVVTADGTPIFGSAPLQSPVYWDLASVGQQTVSGGTLVNAGPLGRGPNDYWQCTAVGQSITVDLKASYGLVAVGFGTYPRNDVSQAPSGFSIDYGPDNVQWENLATISGNKNVLVTVTRNQDGILGKFTARYVRVTITGFQPGQTSARIAGLHILSADYASGLGGQPWLVDSSGNVKLVTGGDLTAAGRRFCRHYYGTDYQLQFIRVSIGTYTEYSRGYYNWTFVQPFAIAPTVVATLESSQMYLTFGIKHSRPATTGVTIKWPTIATYPFYLHALAGGPV